MRDELTDKDSGISPASSSATLSSGSGGWDGFLLAGSTSATMFSPGEIEILGHALDFCHSLYTDKYLPTGELVTQHMQGAASILASLRVDSDTLVAGILHAVPDYLDGYEEKLHAAFNPTIAHLVEGVARMGRIRTLGPEAPRLRETAMRKSRHYAKCCWRWRRTFVSSSSPLADRVQTMRYIAANNVPEGAEIAHETMDIFAPLANRLGLWQVKWELEDFSFRIVEPERYKKIADIARGYAPHSGTLYCPDGG